MSVTYHRETITLDDPRVNARQRRAIETIRDGVVRRHYGEEYADKHELKEFDVILSSASFEGDTEPTRATLLVSLTTGLKGDEGTMARLFCRRHLTIVVGERGAVRVLGVKGRPRLGWWFEVWHGAFDGIGNQRKLRKVRTA